MVVTCGRRRMKTIIAGSRDFNDLELLSWTMQTLLWEPDEIISGGARGADKLGEEWAHDEGISVNLFPADWDTFGKSAGMIRNKEMAKAAEALVAFWDGKSKGTKNMIEEAAKAGLYIKVIRYD